MKRMLGVLLVFNLLCVSVFAANVPRNQILEIYNYGSTVEAKVPLLNSNGMSVKLTIHKGAGETFQDIRKHIEESLVSPVGEQGFPYKIVSNSRDYNYYKTQLRTGNYSNINCMAASAATITTWLDQYSTWSVEKIRRSVRPQGGLIYTNEISDFFYENDIDYNTHWFFTKDQKKEIQGLIDLLDKGSILMTCADTSAISPHKNDNILLGKGYSSSSKHSYIISGYVLFEDDLYFEVFDPADSTPRKRYFKGEQVYNSIVKHWEGVFEIPPQEWKEADIAA